MHPILFNIGSLTIYTYGFLVAVAFCIGIFWTAFRAKAAGEDADDYLNALLLMIVIGFLGARLLYVVYYPDRYFEDWGRLFSDRSGLVWYGGFFSAVVTAYAYVKAKGIRASVFGDILVLPAAVGLAIGRIGCFMTGCCFGKPCELPWAVQFPMAHATHPAFVHPAQLYEAGGLLVLAVLLHQLYKRSTMAGATLCSFFIGYGVLRFIIEYFRGDAIFWVGNMLTASQLMSVGSVFIGMFTLGILIHHHQRPANE